MKKIYLFLAGAFVAGTTFAQTVKDPGFEGTFISGAQLGMPTDNIAGMTSDMATLDWIGIFKKNTSNPINGGGSAQIMNVDDQVAADSLWGVGSNPKTSGFIQQQVTEGVPADPTTSTFTFNYSYNATETDTALVVVQIVDANDNVLWQGMWMNWNNTSGVETGSLTTWMQGASGTPAYAVLLFASSAANFFDDVDAPQGTTFMVDDVSWTSQGSAVEDNDIRLNVYPNPASEVLNVDVANGSATGIAIYNLSGNLVKSADLTGVSSSINVANLSNGMYFYVVSTKEGIELKNKFIKQ